MTKIFILLLLFVNMMVFSPASMAFAKGTILFVPHDNRPTSCEQSAEAPRLLGYDVLMPPKELLGGLHKKGNVTELWNWVNDNIKKADAAVVSADSMIYGGLVASRKHELSSQELNQQVKRFSEIKKNNPKVQLYTFSSLMRTPKNGENAGTEEPEYYQVYGEKIFKASALLDKSELRKLTEDERQQLEMYRNGVPKKNWNDYFDRRKKNLTVTKKLIDLVSGKAIDYMVVGKDDNAPYCATHKEARDLKKYAKELTKNKFLVATGIDEFSMLLLARAVNKLENNHYKVNVQYNVGTGGDTVPAFSDEKISASIHDELAIVGARSTDFPDIADLVLLVNTNPDGRTQDGAPLANDPDPIHNDGNPRYGTWEFLHMVQDNLAQNRPVSVADISFANGSDNALMKLMKKKQLLFKLRSYSGWNTATNSCGFALGQGLVSLKLSQNQCNSMVIRRYLDDWGYQSNVRGKLAQTFPSGKYYFDLGDYEETAKSFTQRELRSFAGANFPEYPGLENLKVYFPWHLPFIGGIQIPEAKFIDDKTGFYGRWNVGLEKAECGQGATYIRARFKGSRIGVKMQDKNSWWRYEIDGKQYPRLKFTEPVTILADGLSPAEHTIRLVRSVEGEAGISTFYGFVVGDDGELLDLQEPKRLKLEFVGDSILAGGFNDGIPHKEPYYEIEDNDMSFGPQLARMLDADYSVVAKSGEGICHNYGETWPGHEVHTADRYPWTFYSFDMDKSHLLWNFRLNPSDAVIISIGTNDFTDKNRKPTEKEFVAAYKHLLEVVRSNNPSVPIICVEPVPTMIGPYAAKWTERAVKELKRQGDNQLYYIPLNKDKPFFEDSDYVGDGTHPTKAGSRKIALYLLDKVKAILSIK